MSHGSVRHTNSWLKWRRITWRTAFAGRGKTSNSFSCLIPGLWQLWSNHSLTGDSVEDVLVVVQVTDVDWNVVMWMCHRITVAWTSVFPPSAVRQEYCSEEDERLWRSHLPRTVSLYQDRVPGHFVQHVGQEWSKSCRRDLVTGGDTEYWYWNEFWSWCSGECLGLSGSSAVLAVTCIVESNPHLVKIYGPPMMLKINYRLNFKLDLILFKVCSRKKGKKFKKKGKIGPRSSSHLDQSGGRD